MTAIKQQEEKSFLEGPRSRRKELIFTLKVVLEFIRGFRKFHFLGPCATVFGSARFTEQHPFYDKARQLSAEVSRLGFTILTGGGPGIMEAANRGAKEAGGRSAGCNITLPHEQQPNPYLDTWVSMNYFFVRKVLLTKYSYVFIVMPGGYGTLDEFFEALTLVQTQKVKNFPVVLFGTEYHQKLKDHLIYCAEQGAIDRSDLDLFLFTDNITDAIHFIEHNAILRFDLRKKKTMRPVGLLGELRR